MSGITRIVGRLEAVIPAGGDTSQLLDFGPYSSGIMHFPSNFTGTAISFLVSPGGLAEEQELEDSLTGEVLSYTVAADKAMVMDPVLFSMTSFRIKAGSAQVTEATVTLIVKS